jgi:uncharacterized protein
VDPVRTCVGCRERAEQKSMVRLVRGSDGLVVVGRTLPGRGAWIHRGCFELALGKGRLSRALRASLSEEEIATLRKNTGRDGEP